MGGTKVATSDKLTNEEDYIKSGALFIDTSKYYSVDKNISSKLKSDHTCSNESITVTAGRFEVEKCITTYDDNRTVIKKIIHYMMPKTSKSRPFYGHIKDIIVLKDGTILSSELVDWNNL